MKDELFREKLSEVAEWHIPKIKLDSRERERRGRRSNEELYQEEHEQVFTELYDGVNPTQNIELIKLKCSDSVCEDCGKACKGQRVKDIVVWEGQGRRLWREKCTNCKMSKDPVLGTFTVKPVEISNVFNSYARSLNSGKPTRTYNKRQNNPEDSSDV